jgi:SAM-dependent methyltransferase
LRDIVRRFAEDVATNFDIAEPLVEIGARAAEGQEDIADVRGIFKATRHIGCDIQEGLGVDQIEDVHALSFEDNSVGTVVCLDTLEHVADPIRALEEIHRVLKPGGMVAMSSVMFFVIHAHPWDYWRFTPEGFNLLLKPFESRLVVAHGWSEMPENVFGIGIKGPAPDLTPERLASVHALATEWPGGANVDFGPIRLTTRQLWGFTLDYTGQAVRRKLGRATARIGLGGGRRDQPE